MNHQPIPIVQIPHWPFVFLFCFLALLLSFTFAFTALDRLYPPHPAASNHQDSSSLLERQTRAAELSALVTYARIRGDGKHEGMSGDVDGLEDATTRLALRVVAGVIAEKDEKKVRGNEKEGCCVM